MKRRDQGGGHRDERAASLLVHLAADYIAKEAGRETLITPMRAEISPDRKNATIYVSVFPDKEMHHALEFLARQKEEFYAYLKKEARFPIIPNVRFEFDFGEQNRQRLDELTKDTGGLSGN
jgi:ribosome-binding factor A